MLSMKIFLAEQSCPSMHQHSFIQKSLGLTFSKTITATLEVAKVNEDNASSL